MKQPADERALSVIDRSACEKAQEFLALMTREVGFDVLLNEFLLGGV
jgi:hypothetical protein